MAELAKVYISELTTDPAVSPALSDIVLPWSRAGKTWKVDGDKIADLVNDKIKTELNLPNIAHYRKHDVTNLGADPELSAAHNISRIQQSIQNASDDGGGYVYVPFRGDGVYKTQTSTDTTTLTFINAGPVLASAPASAMVSILLKHNVMLVLDENVVIENQDPTRSIVGMVGMVGGGIYNAPINWDKVDWGTGVGFSGMFVPWRDGRMATFDFYPLTLLVLLCHEARIRGEVRAKSSGHMELSFFPRSHDGAMHSRHPSIDEAVAAFRKYLPDDHRIIYRAPMQQEIAA